MFKNKQSLKVEEKDVLKLVEYSKNRTTKIADTALLNKIIPFSGFESIDFNPEMWEATKSEKYGKSYSLYIHTLRYCAELMVMFEHTNETKYFDKAEEIIYAWIKYEKKNNDNDMIWYDHTTANRTQVLIQFLYLSSELKRKVNHSLFYDLLVKHAEVMMNDDIYRYNNHSLMMDRALIAIGYVLDERDFVKTGIYRASITYWLSFSSQGVHLENSPQYHIMVLKLYISLEDYLKNRGDTLGVKITKHMSIAKNYPSKIMKPNLQLAEIGDSGPTVSRTRKIFKNLYDMEAGISILQTARPLPFFVTFVAGYSAKTHKHKDDLSITLNYNKIDFFKDPGKYSYTGNSTRRYIVSKAAHSSFYLSDFDYFIQTFNNVSRKVSLDGYLDTSDYTIVKGYNQDFSGSTAKLIRIVCQFKRVPLLVVIDKVQTNVEHSLNFSQNFNFESDVVLTVEENITKMTAKGTTLTMKQFNSPDKVTEIQGDKRKPIAVNTIGYAKVEETKQLLFEKSTNNSIAFITGIYDENYVNSVTVEGTNDFISVSFNDSSYKIYY